jgi:SAM-dependent methyltransferase
MAPIIYYSDSKKVSMADSWFEVATLNHFWIRRRFDVLRGLLGRDYEPSGLVAEVGCGHGLVQSQFRSAYGLAVDGFELNEHALSASVATDQPRFIYDIHERRAELREKYGLIILFDVIEHIEDDAGFLESVLFHLKYGGLLIINVPALQLLFSKYDRAAGHLRRYSLEQLEGVCRKVGLNRVEATYWGAPLLPLLFVRKLMLALHDGEEAVINQGFRPPGHAANKVLGAISGLEPVPQRWVGTSVMGVFEKNTR